MVRKFRYFLVLTLAAFLPLTWQQNSYAADFDDQGFTTDTMIGLLGVGAAVGVGAWAYNQHKDQSKHASPTPGPTPPIPPETSGGPMVLSSHGTLGYTNYNLNSTVESTSANGQIVILNASKTTQPFTITPIDPETEQPLGYSPIVVGQDSSCLQNVSSYGVCSFNISFTSTPKNNKNFVFAPILYRIKGTITTDTDYISVYPIYNGSNAFFNPAIQDTSAHSIHSTHLTSLLTVTRNAINVLYAATDSNGIFMSTDSGNSWIAINNGLTSLHITALATDGTNLYASATIPSTTPNSSHGAIFKSKMHGAYWSEITNNIPTNFEPNTLAWDKKNLYVGGLFVTGKTAKKKSNSGDGSIFVKNSNNDNWKQSTIKATSIITLYFDGQFLFAGTTDGIFKKDENIDSWTQSQTGSFIISITKAGTNWYAVKYPNEIIISSDGSGWTDFTTLTGANIVYPIYNDLYIGTLDGKILRIPLTTPNAAPEDISGGLFPGYSINNILFIAGNIYIGSYGGGAYRNATSKNDLVYWNPLSSGLADVGIAAIQEYRNQSPQMETTFYAGTQGFGVYKSTDFGANWVPDNDGISLSTYKVLALYLFDDTQKVNLYAGFDGSAYTKNLSAQETTWSEIQNLSNKTITSFVGSNSLNDGQSSMLAGTKADSQMLYRSDNGGTWNPSNPGLAPATNINSLGSGPQNLFASVKLANAIYDSVYRYEYSSGQWQWANDDFPLLNSFIYTLELFNQNLYIGCDQGIYRRENPTQGSKNTTSWTNFNSGALQNTIPIHALFNQAGDGYFYAAGVQGTNPNSYTAFRILGTGGAWEGIGQPAKQIDILSLSGIGGVLNAYTTLFAGTAAQGIQQIFLANSAQKSMDKRN